MFHRGLPSRLTFQKVILNLLPADGPARPPKSGLSDDAHLLRYPRQDLRRAVQ